MSRAESRAPTTVITIDGPAASGKSSTAKRVAERLGVRHADSGALYRAAAVARLREGGDPQSWTEASVLAAAARSVSLVPAETSFEVHIDGERAGPALYRSEVTSVVSLVATMPGVRAWVNERMRDCAGLASIVVDGRDMGSEVFPGARLKVFLVADPRERARRRLAQRFGRIPGEEEIEVEAAELAQRDARDARQTQQAADAVLIDTTHLTQEEQVSRIVALAQSL